MWKQKIEEIIEMVRTYLYLNTEFIDKYDNFIIFGASSSGAKTKKALDKLGKK